MKSILVASIALVLVLCCWLGPLAHADGGSPPAGTENTAPSFAPWTGAKAAALMDVNSYRLLTGKNLERRLPMASTTKIMTALVAIESGRLEEMVTVKPSALQVEPSCIWLEAGERVKLHDLLYGLMLRSGNDAALAIAEFLGGSVSGFAEMMNDKAAELGLTNTHFVNPHGLHHPEHYTSAYDLARLAAYALRNPLFTAVVSCQEITVPRENKAAWHWTNKNQLLATYPGGDGVKTGWTKTAGRCLVASANRSGFRLVAVVLHSPDDWNEASALLDWGYREFEPTQLVRQGEVVQSTPVQRGYPAEVKLRAGADFFWPARRGETASPQREIILPNVVAAPLDEGQQLGTIRIADDDGCYAEIPLLVEQTIHRGWWRHFLQNILSRMSQMLLQLAGVSQR